jgi:hypothetical protein
MQDGVWHQQCRLEEEKSEVLCAVEIFERLGVAGEVQGPAGVHLLIMMSHNLTFTRVIPKKTMHSINDDIVCPGD